MKYDELDPSWIQRLATMLPEQPVGFAVTCETIAEQGKPPFPRVGIHLAELVREATITLTFTEHGPG